MRQGRQWEGPAREIGFAAGLWRRDDFVAERILGVVFNWMRRRRADEPSSAADRAAAETRQLAEAALRTAEAVKQQLEQDRQALASLIESIKPKNETPRRFVTLASAMAACAVIVIVAASLIPPAFSAPPPNYSDAGVASLYVWANSLNTEQAEALRNPGVSLRVIADQRSSYLEYVATFPKRLIGDRFVLGISGTAVLSDLKSDASDVSNEYPECQVESHDGRATPRLCQLITGIVPSVSSESALGCRSMDKEEAISIRFSGNAHVNSSFDWAHHIASIPYLGDVPGLGPGSVDDLVEGTFGQNFPSASLTTCYYLALNPEWTEYTPDFAPTYHIGDEMTWDPASNEASYIVVSTERGAQWKGNVLLAILGVFGPAFLSLVVVTVRSGYRLRSQSPRRRK